jgi:phosphoribosylanthranilate isomerase
MLTQIYEISSPEEARAVSLIGVDHVGVLVGDGQFPREQAIAAAATIAAAIVPPAKFSALFLTADMSLIEVWARELCPAIMRSVPVSGEASLGIAQAYDGLADSILLDSYRACDRQIGALGVTHDWRISRRIVERVQIPVVLAGGLGPDNVAEAIRIVRPAGVDSKTKTDADGSHAKDIERVRRFHEAARATR